MELKTKYQYTYFIYPYLMEEKEYANYLYHLLKKKQCKLKLFDRKKHVEIDSYFLPEVKDKMFWSLNLNREAIKNYESMDTKMKANVLAKKQACFFEYTLEEDIPAKIGEQSGIFFDITKVEIACFSTGICFLLIKTVLNENASFSDVLNFNYKFRDIVSKLGHTKEYDNIKIQTNKFQNMQEISEFVEQIAGVNILAKQINLDTNRLITYSYCCLDQNSWNENTDQSLLEKEFQKYNHIEQAGTQIDDSKLKKEAVHKEKYKYYGFSSNSTMLLTSASNIRNYTSLLFHYEQEELYHFLYHLHQKITLKKLNYQFSKTKDFTKVQKQFLHFAKREWIYEVTNETQGVILEKYFRQTQNLDETFFKLKNEYDLLYKEYEISKSAKQNKWIIVAIAIMIIVNLINGWLLLNSR